MKSKTKTDIKNKLFQFTIMLVIALVITLGVGQLFNKAEQITMIQKAKAVSFFDTSYTIPEVSISRKVKKETTKQYGYNKQVPKEVVIEEIKKQAKEFGLGENYMLNLAFCESGYNNLAKNPNSTAVGVYQYLIGTWNETPSWKNHKIARTDYKANIREAMIDISNGESFRWSECLK